MARTMHEYDLFTSVGGMGLAAQNGKVISVTQVEWLDLLHLSRCM